MNAKIVRCATHGDEPWRGDVVCDACRRVFQTRDSNAPLFAPYDCVCGAPLMPVRPEGDPLRVAGARRKRFTARSICAHCFEERAAGLS